MTACRHKTPEAEDNAGDKNREDLTSVASVNVFHTAAVETTKWLQSGVIFMRNPSDEQRVVALKFRKLKSRTFGVSSGL